MVKITLAKLHFFLQCSFVKLHCTEIVNCYRNSKFGVQFYPDIKENIQVTASICSKISNVCNIFKQTYNNFGHVWFEVAKIFLYFSP